MADATRFVFKGVPERSAQLTRPASVVLGTLLKEMKFQGLQQGMKRYYLPDGTEIFCQSFFGQHQVTITTSPIQTVKSAGVTKLDLTRQDLYMFIWEDNTRIEFLIYDPIANKCQMDTRYSITKNSTLASKAMRTYPEDKFPYWSALHALMSSKCNTLSHLRVIGTYPDNWTTWQDYCMDFHAASCPVKNWPTYAWMVCVGGNGFLAPGNTYLGSKHKTALIFNLGTKEVVADFQITGDDPSDAASGFNVTEGIDNQIIVTQTGEVGYIRTTTLGKHPTTGKLAILSVTEAVGSSVSGAQRFLNIFTGEVENIGLVLSTQVGAGTVTSGTYPVAWHRTRDLDYAAVYPLFNMDLHFIEDYDEYGTWVDPDHWSIIASLNITGRGDVNGYHFAPVRIYYGEQVTGYEGDFTGDGYVTYWNTTTNTGGPKLRHMGLYAADNLLVDLAMWEDQIQSTQIPPPPTQLHVFDEWHTEQVGGSMSMKYVPSISMAAGQYSAMMLTKRDITGGKLYLKKVSTTPDIPPIEIEGGDGTLLSATLRAGTKPSLEAASWVDITSTVDPYLRYHLTDAYLGLVGVFIFST